jgi:hypothetical protein
MSLLPMGVYGICIFGYEEKIVGTWIDFGEGVRVFAVHCLQGSKRSHEYKQ